MFTPWGLSDSVKKVTEGILYVTTPSHGGFKVNEKLLSLIPSHWVAATQ